MRNIGAIFRRELLAYFLTPLACVFLVIFLLLAGTLTFQEGNLLGRGQADLAPFFAFHPWLFLFLLPAIAMRLWSEERKSGTIELLLTLPISTFEAVVGKFLAAWAFTALALALTLPVWLTVNHLGDPDNGAILAGYVGSLLMAGGYLAIGSCLSALTRNQVIAFVLAVATCFAFVMAGYPTVLGVVQAVAPSFVVDAVASMGFLTHFESISKGVLDARDVLFFGSLIVVWLFATVVVLDLRKAES